MTTFERQVLRFVQARLPDVRMVQWRRSDNARVELHGGWSLNLVALMLGSRQAREPWHMANKLVLAIERHEAERLAQVPG